MEILTSEKCRNVLRKSQRDLTIKDCLYLLAFTTQSLDQPYEYYKSNAKFILGVEGEFLLKETWNSVSEEMKGLQNERN